MDVRIYHTWLGDGLMGVGLTKDQAVEMARESGKDTGAWGKDGTLRGAFDSEDDYMNVLDVGSDWLSECSLTVLALLTTREEGEWGWEDDYDDGPYDPTRAGGLYEPLTD